MNRFGNNMKVLIRKREGQMYMQRSGAWTPNRATARRFESSIFAYWWAKERALAGIEVLVAFEDPEFDFVPMRL